MSFCRTQQQFLPLFLCTLQTRMYRTCGRVLSVCACLSVCQSLAKISQRRVTKAKLKQTMTHSKACRLCSVLTEDQKKSEVLPELSINDRYRPIDYRFCKFSPDRSERQHLAVFDNVDQGYGRFLPELLITVIIVHHGAKNYHFAIFHPIQVYREGPHSILKFGSITQCKYQTLVPCDVHMSMTTEACF